MGRARIVMIVALAALAWPARAQVVDPPELGDGPDPDCVAAVHGWESTPPRRASEGRALAVLPEAECTARLTALGVAFAPVAATDAPGVRSPIRLAGPIAGIAIKGRHDVLDCRLALGIAEWAPALRAQGVKALVAISIHRPGARVAGSRRVSGHAHALAIDIGAVELDDGTVVDVLNGWEARRRGADPCATYAESDRSARLRAVVCAAVRAGLFQIVLTPHHDRAHENHVHLELVPDVSWSYVR